MELCRTALLPEQCLCAAGPTTFHCYCCTKRGSAVVYLQKTNEKEKAHPWQMRPSAAAQAERAVGALPALFEGGI
eukprot:SAG25_NODE_1580_length_2738_cov_1.670330_1_plen_74_part_10